MDPVKLIPTPEVIPAPWQVFEFLGILTLIVHFLFINVALGGSLIALFSRLKGAGRQPGENVPGLLAGKIPTTFALGINFGVAPLLFVQVLYGHFFYTSSVLMAVFWIMVIPLLIIGYYGTYIHARQHDTAPALATAALAFTSVILLYIVFAFQNNISLMLSPGAWTAYFANRSGTILRLGDPVLWPRYFHFVTASIAVAGLFIAVLWAFRQKKGAAGAGEKKRDGLRIFAIATMIQVVIGFWLLLALPKEVMLKFMGGNMLYTVTLFAGIVLALATIMTSLLGRLGSTVAVLLATVAVMVLLRTFLRTAFLAPYFNIEILSVHPQVSAGVLFLVILVIGLVLVGYMIKWAAAPESRKEAV
ncbi:MAG TPA: hypothetical protein VM123_18490 [archaeon]|nr:hypothetical protein [archaeon]